MGFFSKRKEKKEAEAAETKTETEEVQTEEPAEVILVEDEASEEAAAKKSNSKAAYFVSPCEGGWQVKKAGAQKALKIFKTKKEAEEYAKTVAKNQGTHVVYQKKDGTIQKKH